MEDEGCARILGGQGSQLHPEHRRGQRAHGPTPERQAPGRETHGRGRQLPESVHEPVGPGGPGRIAQHFQWRPAGIEGEAKARKFAPVVLRRAPQTPLGGAKTPHRRSREIFHPRLAIPRAGNEGGTVELEGPCMVETVEADAVATGHDAAQQIRMSRPLIRETEPGGLRAQIVAERQRQIRRVGKPVLEPIMGIRRVIGRAAKLVPVLPVEGEGQAVGRAGHRGHGITRKAQKKCLSPKLARTGGGPTWSMAGT